MPNKFPQKHPLQDAQDWNMVEWLQLFGPEPGPSELQPYAEVDRSFRIPEGLTGYDHLAARRACIIDTSLKLQGDVEKLVKYAALGDNQSLLVLARLGAFICQSLNENYERTPERVTFLSKRLTAWPINLEDRPHVLASLNVLLKDLSVGQVTNEPYDVPRSLTKGQGIAKTVAIQLVLIIDTLEKFGCAAEEVEIMKTEFIVIPNQYDENKKASLLTSAIRQADQLFEKAERHLNNFANFLEVKNPFTSREQVYRESRTCHGLNEVTGRDAWAERGVELLEKFTDDKPERCRVFGETGKSTARATLQAAGKKSVPLPPRSIATGIRGQVKKAFKSLRRADGTLGTEPNVSWSDRKRIDHFLKTGKLPDAEMAAIKHFTTGK